MKIVRDHQEILQLRLKYLMEDFIAYELMLCQLAYADGFH